METVMRYDIQTEETDMKAMRPAQFDELLKKKVDEYHGSRTNLWEELEEEFRKMGHKSERTGKCLTATALKQRYYHLKRLDDAAASGRSVQHSSPSESRAEKDLGLIRMFMALDTSEKAKLNLIQQVLDGNAI